MPPKRRMAPTPFAECSWCRSEKLFLIRQSRSAFVASSLQNLPAAGAGHSLAETVNLLAVQFLGLICPFHLIPSFIKCEVWASAGGFVSKIQRAVDFTSQISRNLQDNSIKENQRICQLFFRKIHIFPGFFPGNFSGRRKSPDSTKKCAFFEKEIFVFF